MSGALNCILKSMRKWLTQEIKIKIVLKLNAVKTITPVKLGLTKQELKCKGSSNFID